MTSEYKCLSTSYGLLGHQQLPACDKAYSHRAFLDNLWGYPSRPYKQFFSVQLLRSRTLPFECASSGSRHFRSDLNPDCCLAIPGTTGCCCLDATSWLNRCNKPASAVNCKRRKRFFHHFQK